MHKHKFATSLALIATALPSCALATDRAEASLKAVTSQSSEYAFAVETIAVVIRSGSDELWSGTLRIGGPSGNASFSQSKNEFAAPCPGEPLPSARMSLSSHRINFNMSRRNWQQQPDSFYINVNWTRPLSACQGEGADNVGFNRVVEIRAGQTVSIEGAGGLVVRLTRQS